MAMTSPFCSDPTARAYIAFGANLGNPVETYAGALDAIAALATTRVVSYSSLYRSEAVGVSGHPDYTNAVIAVDTQLKPIALLESLLEIERIGGRIRDHSIAPRTLDLDLLLYGDTLLSTPALQLPHPRMHQRAFVLLPLAEIAPDVDIPGHGPIRRLLARVGNQRIARIEAPAPRLTT